MKLSLYNQIFAENKDKWIEEWKEFLRFESVSTDSSYHPKCIMCAEWVKDKLQSFGFESSLYETPTKPLVLAQRKGNPNQPTFLIYGHYDVQPADPLELWKTPPFEPTIRDGKMFARGAQDNKGQIFFLMKAAETIIKTMKDDAPTIKFLIEGEEECSSIGLAAVLPDLKEKISADVLLVSDTGTIDPNYGCITVGLRGIAHMEVVLKGPNKDLHSGIHGGVVKNPITELSRIIATLHDSKGKVSVAGYYDGIRTATEKEKKLANELPLTEAWYQAQVGIAPTGGEAGLSAVERRGFRPTLEINGIYGGYMGEGMKTVIPSFAGVKLSMRLVEGQVPDSILDSVEKHIRDVAPKEMKIEIIHKGFGGPALWVSPDDKYSKHAGSVLKTVMQKDPLFMWEGASIPIIPSLAKASGASPLLMGFGLEEDNIHAPNESFRLQQWERGFLSACGVLEGS